MKLYSDQQLLYRYNQQALPTGVAEEGLGVSCPLLSDAIQEGISCCHTQC